MGVELGGRGGGADATFEVQVVLDDPAVAAGLDHVAASISASTTSPSRSPLT